jgi:ribose transport system substrate-binding protein
LLKNDIDKAVGMGIAVLTVDSDAPASKRLFLIGTNNYQAGLSGGQRLAKELHGKGSVVVFSMPDQVNLKQRLQGYQDALQSSPGIKITRIVDIKGDPRIAFDTASEILGKERSKVDGFICLEALSCKEVADVLDRKKITGKMIIAMDTDQGVLDWIKKGVIAATIAQKPFTMAYQGLKMLDDLHHNKPNLQDDVLLHGPFARFPSFIDTGATLIDKSNLDDFIKRRDEAAAAKSGAQ